MAKRSSGGGGRRPEPDYQREMRRAFDSSNKENEPADNRTLIPQLMRELVQVHRYRRSLPAQPQIQMQALPQGGAYAPPPRYRRRTPVPPREMPPVYSQMAQPGTSSQAGQRAVAAGAKKREPVATVRPRAKDAKNEEPLRQLSPDEQFELDMMLAIERSLEECFTPAVNPLPDVQVPEKDEGIPHGEMTVKAEVHREGTTPKKFVSHEPLPPEHPDHWATAEQFGTEPLYAVPHKNKDDDAKEIGRPGSPTPSSDSLSDRPPTPHPRSWLPIAMNYLGENSPQNIHQQQEFEDKKQHEIQNMLSEEEQYQLDTQLAIQYSLREAFKNASPKPIGRTETGKMTSQEKKANACESGMSATGSLQPKDLDEITPAGMNAQYAGTDCAMMATAKGEIVTNNLFGTGCNIPPKPARLYVRGVNAPPGMMEPIPTVVQRVSNAVCPPPSPTDLGWENIIPGTSGRPQQDLSSEEQTGTCCNTFMEFVMEGINTVGHHLSLLGDYTWRYLCHCDPIQGTCASN